MLSLRCKMCGGALNVAEDVAVAECEYCGTKQTLPKLNDEKIAAMFDRANQCRSMNEFDKAALIYENILAESPDEAEAYWGLCLCRYGIEYVVDPRTNKRVPTCHRTQFGSILQDKDFLSAIGQADFMAREVYMSEAMYIDNIQKNILAISSKEAPFDIFICYKETDERGDRTIDSVIAQDIYDALTEKGYKVFFARITLEDKLGTAYEPYIFAALNSAKIMLVVGTEPAHFEAVWVRNEWSRYLALIEQGEKKTVIPCYRNMSPYDLPREFLALQAQDVSKVGYMQDLLRGVQKILAPEGNGQLGGVKPAPVRVEVPKKPSSQIQIVSVKSIGTNRVDDYWAKGTVSSTINRNLHSVIDFQMTLQRQFGFEGDIKLNFKVRDDIGNLVTNETSTITVAKTDDRLAQTFVLRGEDGSVIQAGTYKASFSVNGGPEFEYTFKVEAGVHKKNPTPPPAPTPPPTPVYQPPQTYVEEPGVSVQEPQPKKKSLLIFSLLAFFLGCVGAHEFYAGRKGMGFLYILATILNNGHVAYLAAWIVMAIALVQRRVPTKKAKLK